MSTIFYEVEYKRLGALEVKHQGTTKTFDDYVTYVPHM